MRLTPQIMKKIEKFAIEKYKHKDFAHKPDHVYRTAKLAEFIAKKEKADVNICKATAFLHDIAHSTSKYKPDHSEEGAKVAEKFLRKLKVDNDIIEQVSHAIYHHSQRKVLKAKTKEAKIVSDADKLEKIGPLGFFRVYTYRMLIQKVPPEEAFRKTMKRQEETYNKLLQTKTAKNLAKNPHKLMKQFFKLHYKVRYYGSN